MKFLSFLLLFTLYTTLIFGQDTLYGKASFYADKFNGRLTANGEIFDNKKISAAHKTLPFNTYVKVTNLSNDKSIVVRINDRGPFVEDRIIDLSKAAANSLDFVNDGVTDVRVEILDGFVNEEIKDSNQQLTTNNLFEVSVEQIKKGNFAIQVASYKYVENMLNEIVNLKKDYGEKTLVHVSAFRGERVYRVIVGPYETREKAEKKLAKFQKKSKDGFIINLGDLE